jgi:hypothetical protein
MKKRSIVVVFLFVVSIGICLLLINSCAAGHQPEKLKSYNVSQNFLQEILKDIESYDYEINYFNKLGTNRISFWVNITIALSTIFAGIVSILSGVQQNEKRKSVKRGKTIIIFSIVVTIISGSNIFLKNENDRFYNENKNQYRALAHKIEIRVERFYTEIYSLSSTSEKIEKNENTISNKYVDFRSDITNIKSAYNEIGLMVYPKIQ